MVSHWLNLAKFLLLSKNGHFHALRAPPSGIFKVTSRDPQSFWMPLGPNDPARYFFGPGTDLHFGP